MVDRMEVQVRSMNDRVWVATAPSVRVTETGDSYEAAIQALRSTLERLLTHDVVLEVTAVIPED